MPRELPARAEISHYVREADNLLVDWQKGHAESLSRRRAFFPNPAKAERTGSGEPRFSKSDAQFVLAREHGFRDWDRFKDHIGAIVAGGTKHHAFVPEIEYYEGRAFGLFSVVKTGQSRALQLVRESHPRLGDASDEAIKQAGFTLADARLVLAREHGCLDWETFVAYIQDLSNGSITEPFMTAYDSIKAGDLGRLKTTLTKSPALINAKGTNGNRLLTLATSLKQIDIVEHLIAAGADVDLPNNKGWTPLHAAAYGDPESGRGAYVKLLKILLDAGASVELTAHGDGGTALVQALFWGHRPQAEILADHGIFPNNLRVAAGLGRLDLVQSFIGAGGTLKPGAGAHREFHRPHSGFPEWFPSNEPQEILDEAFVWACKNGQIGVLDFFLKAGANIDSDPYRGTGLTWAAFRGDLQTAGWLLDHGAKVNHKATFGGPEHGVGITALHLAAQHGHLDMAKLLFERGADVNIRDDLHQGSSPGWADYCGQTKVRDFLLRDEPQLDLLNAVEFNRVDRVRVLLDADPAMANGVDGKGAPLRIAAHNGHLQIVKLLLNGGADPSLANPKGKTALAWARERKHQKIVRVLRKYGAAD